MKTQMHNTSPSVADRLKDIVQYSELKRMADTIMIQQRKKQFRTLAVLSFFPGEGKTLFSAVMAMAYAEAYQSRVLAVDTTTFTNPHSLSLRQCLAGSYPLIDFLSLEEYRKGPIPVTTTNGHSAPVRERTSASGGGESVAVKTEVVSATPQTGLWFKKESDQFLLRKLADERAAQYSLVLLDTAPLMARNKGNLDPMLVARIADASVLVVNPASLDSPDLEAQLKVLKDPNMNLIGLISNEEFFK